MMEAQQLKVTAKQPEANDTVSIDFEWPSSLGTSFDYWPGQFLTLEFNIEGELLRRAYSLSSCPYSDEHFRVTVKRVDDGRVSNHIHDRLAVGDSVRVLPPQGKFHVQPNAQSYKTYYLLGAGSGITPLMSILQSVLLKEPRSHVVLMLGNRSESTIIFDQQLAELAQQHGDRFQPIHALTQPRGTLSALWHWDGYERVVHRGRIDESALRWLFREYPPVAQDAQYFVCGPGDMIEAVLAALQTIGVPEDRCHHEYFATNPRPTHDIAQVVPNAQLTAQLASDSVSTTIDEGETVLRSLIAAGVDAPYSCESGVCGACKARLSTGTVHQGSVAGLERSEIDAGYVLTCQAKPTSEQLSVAF